MGGSVLRVRLRLRLRVRGVLWWPPERCYLKQSCGLKVPFFSLVRPNQEGCIAEIHQAKPFLTLTATNIQFRNIQFMLVD